MCELTENERMDDKEKEAILLNLVRNEGKWKLADDNWRLPAVVSVKKALSKSGIDFGIYEKAVTKARL